MMINTEESGSPPHQIIKIGSYNSRNVTKMSQTLRHFIAPIKEERAEKDQNPRIQIEAEHENQPFKEFRSNQRMTTKSRSHGKDCICIS